MAERVPPLTAAQVMNLKPDPAKTAELIDGAVPGLWLRVTPNGTRTWSLNMRASRAMRRFDVGSGLGLSDARKRATELRRRIQDGEDPTAERRAARERAKAAEKGVGTFGALIEDYFSTGPGAGLRSKLEQLQRLRFVFSEHLLRPAAELDGLLTFSFDAGSPGLVFRLGNSPLMTILSRKWPGCIRPCARCTSCDARSPS